MDSQIVILLKNDFKKELTWQIIMHDLTLPEETTSVELKVVEAKPAYK